MVLDHVSGMTATAARTSLWVSNIPVMAAGSETGDRGTMGVVVVVLVTGGLADEPEPPPHAVSNSVRLSIAI
jgi:hypothetical protein